VVIVDTRRLADSSPPHHRTTSSDRQITLYRAQLLRRRPPVRHRRRQDGLTSSLSWPIVLCDARSKGNYCKDVLIALVEHVLVTASEEPTSSEDRLDFRGPRSRPRPLCSDGDRAPAHTRSQGASRSEGHDPRFYQPQ